MLLPCLLHVLLPRYLRFLGAGLHLSHLSHFRGPAQRARSRTWCFSCSRIRIAQTSFGLRGRFCPVIRPLFKAGFVGGRKVCILPSMIASVESNPPSQRLPLNRH